MSTFFVQCNMPDIWRAAAKGVASRQAMLAGCLQPGRTSWAGILFVESSNWFMDKNQRLNLDF
jgi:hypothetical protein